MALVWKNVARRIRVPAGFIFAAVYLWAASPSLSSIWLSLLLVIPGLLLRGYASGHVKKNVGLTTSGPYAYTRNPLYLGSMLIAFGFAAASRSWAIVVALGIAFALIYIPTIRAEEEFLSGRFSEFKSYCAQVPRLVPRLTPQPPAAGEKARFSSALYLRHREYNALLGACAVYAALLAKIWTRR